MHSCCLLHTQRISTLGVASNAHDGPVGGSVIHFTARTERKGEVKVTATNRGHVLCTVCWLSLLPHPAYNSHEKHLQRPWRQAR